MNKLLIGFITILLPLNLLWGATIYVSPDGSGSTCSSGSPCALSYANTNAVAGDTVYLKAGIYYTTGIAPANSGTCATTCPGGVGASKITYQNAPGETATICSSADCSTVEGTSIGIYFSGVNWIKVTGINVTNMYNLVKFDYSASYNEVSYGTLTNTPGATGADAANYPILFWDYVGAGDFSRSCQHNWVHHNTISGAHGTTDDCIEGVDLIRLGGDPVGLDLAYGSDYNTIENNTLSKGGHGILDSFGRYLVFKNNVIHNEPWRSGSGCVSPSYPNDQYVNTDYNGKYGHRNVQITGEGHITSGLRNLIEGNRLGHSSVNPNNTGADNLDVAGHKNIIRYNALFNSMAVGLMYKYTAFSWGGLNNRVYNNTFYRSGFGYSGPPWLNKYYSVYIDSSTASLGNVQKNDLIYQSGQYGSPSPPYAWDIGEPADWANMTFANLFCTAAPASDPTHIPAACSASSGDPKFVNPDLTDPTSLTLPNLYLQASSPAKDGGTYLTTATAASGGTPTTLPVADVMYFQDGTWGSDLARGVTFFPDWICVGTVSNCAQISSISYGTYPEGTITLASGLTWSDGASVWLYCKSDGCSTGRVLYGSAPDYGAFEYGQVGSPSGPAISGGLCINCQVIQ